MGERLPAPEFNDTEWCTEDRLSADRLRFRSTKRGAAEPEHIISTPPPPAKRPRPDLGQTWLNAVDEISARTRTLNRLMNDARYPGRRDSVIRTRGDLMRAHEVLTAVLADLDAHAQRAEQRARAASAQPTTTPTTTGETTNDEHCSSQESRTATEAGSVSRAG